MRPCILTILGVLLLLQGELLSQNMILQPAPGETLVLQDTIVEDNDIPPQSYEYGASLFIEIVGKTEYFSINTDFRLWRNHRIGFGVSLGSFEVNDTTEGNEWEQREYFAPGVMYYLLTGKRKSHFEFGAGVSVPLNHKYEYKLTPLLIHAVFGYRMQTKNGFLLRAGFTPQYQPPDGFLPLVGLSLGYSW